MILFQSCTPEIQCKFKSIGISHKILTVCIRDCIFPKKILKKDILDSGIEMKHTYTISAIIPSSTGYHKSEN